MESHAATCGGAVDSKDAISWDCLGYNYETLVLLRALGVEPRLHRQLCPAARYGLFAPQRIGWFRKVEYGGDVVWAPLNIMF